MAGTVASAQIRRDVLLLAKDLWLSWGVGRTLE